MISERGGPDVRGIPGGEFMLVLLAWCEAMKRCTFLHMLRLIILAFGLHGAQVLAAINETWALRYILTVSAVDTVTTHATMDDLVLPAGYPLQRYEVVTSDGYVLGVFRIPHGRSTAGQPLPEKPVVYFQHALLDCSASWVNNGPSQSLAFILADAGYDVWLGNSRGNTFSRKHNILDPSSNAFWDFSWDEMAKYDLPATLDAVVAHTGAQQVAYIGHSQGTTIGFAALATQPRLAKLISIAVMLAPVTFLGHITSQPILYLAQKDTDQLFDELGAHEFLPTTKLAVWTYADSCTLLPELCLGVLEWVCGTNPFGNLNLTRLPLYLSYTPAGTSVKNMAHWAQAVRRGAEPDPQFPRYDYGHSCTHLLDLPQKCNLMVYGVDDAPPYNLSRITTPIALFSGGQDRLADERDVHLLIRALPNGTLVMHHEEAAYEHLDFTWGLDAHLVIYPRILSLLRQHPPAASQQFM